MAVKNHLGPPALHRSCAECFSDQLPGRTRAILGYFFSAAVAIARCRRRLRWMASACRTDNQRQRGSINE